MIMRLLSWKFHIPALTACWMLSMGLHAQTADGLDPVTRLLLRCRPPVAVEGKPVTANFVVNLGTTGELTATFERDTSGNARLELRQTANHAPLFAQLWSVKEKAEKLVFYQESTVVVRKAQGSQGWNSWAFGAFEAERTEVHERVADQDARKVILRARGTGDAPVGEAGECWISEPLALVVRERIVSADGATQEWRLTGATAKAPTSDLLAIPAGFQVIDPGARE